MATQWANQTWSRRMRGEAGFPFPNEASGEFSGKGSDVDHKLTGKSDSEYK